MPSIGTPIGRMRFPRIPNIGLSGWNLARVAMSAKRPGLPWGFAIHLFSRGVTLAERGAIARAMDWITAFDQGSGDAGTTAPSCVERQWDLNE